MLDFFEFIFEEAWEKGLIMGFVGNYFCSYLTNNVFFIIKVISVYCRNIDKRGKKNKLVIIYFLKVIIGKILM